MIPCIIEWNPSTELFAIGALHLRYYSLWWLIGLTGSYLLLKQLYKWQQLPAKEFDRLIVYGFIGILVGARLGHCLFYEPSYFLSHPLEIFLPISRDTAGSCHFTGYAGLASHGGTLGLMFALWLYARTTKIGLWQTLDNIAIATPITACCIRIGNFWNSEIIGRATNGDWGVVFSAIDTVPRHPAQLYEAAAYMLIFIIGFALYRWARERLHQGFFFGYCLTAIFLFRFFVEYFKENQVAFESDMLINMGQLLSLPFIALGLFCMLYKEVGNIPLGMPRK